MRQMFEPEPESTQKVEECQHCGTEIVPGEDFCRECGHSVQFTLGGVVEPDDDADLNAGDICPRCGATHMVLTGQGYPQCESCGYMERH